LLDGPVDEPGSLGTEGDGIERGDANETFLRHRFAEEGLDYGGFTACDTDDVRYTDIRINNVGVLTVRRPWSCFLVGNLC
jgi:hypothetical protein